MPQRLAPLRFGLGVDQIDDRFGLGEIEFAVLDRAPRELAGLGRAAVWDRLDGAQQTLDDGTAAMDVKFGHVLAAEAARAGEPQHQALIDGFAVAQLAKDRPAWLRHPATKPIDHGPRRRS